MGKGNTNKNRNAFYYFMLEFKDQHGRNFKSLADVATAASPHWQRLSPQQKEKYLELAKQNRENGQKQTSIGEAIEYVLQDEKEKKERELNIKQDIDNIIKRCVNANTIADHPFYLMHVNEFCYWEKGCKYFPAEIAIGKFTLREGIKKEEVYHALVQPGPLPLGYSAMAKLKSEETHQIQHMGNENNTEEVLLKVIEKLTEVSADSDGFPPIYVSEKDILLIENVLEWMSNDLGHPNLFKLYSLQYLLLSLKNNISPTGLKVWPTISVSKLQLEKDVYDFAHGIACDYHEQAEVPVYCSRSRIIRWAYIICDNCIGDLNVPIIKGQHVPKNSYTGPQVVTTASAFSSRPSASRSESRAASVKSENLYSDVISETSTVVDESEFSSYHGFDSDSQTADDEVEWRRPRRPAPRYKTPQTLSQQSDTSNHLSQASSTTDYVPGRRPKSQSSANPEYALAQSIMNRRGRGRGRGILQAKPPA